MKKLFYFLLLFCLFTSCSNSTTKVINDTNDMPKKTCRFKVIYKQFGYDIILDTETNVKYLYIHNAYGIGLTKLEE